MASSWHRASRGGLIVLVAALAACRAETPAPGPASQTATPVPPPPALASLQVEDAEGVRLEVVEAMRPAAGIVELRLVLVNEGAGDFDLGVRWAASQEEIGAISDLALEEPDGQKRHFVLRDDQGRPLCSTGEAPVAAGERRDLWARFGAPAATVASVRLVAGPTGSADFGLPPVP